MSRRKKKKGANASKGTADDSDGHPEQEPAVTPNHQSDKHQPSPADYKESPKHPWYKPWKRLSNIEPNRMIAYGTVFLGLIGVVGLRFTYESINDSRQAFEATQRPLVSLGRSDGTIAEFVVPSPDALDQNVGLKVYLQNEGPSPALTPNLQIGPPILIVGRGQRPLPKLPVIPEQADLVHLVRWTKGGTLETTRTEGPIAPHSERVYFFRDQITQPEYKSLLVGGRIASFSGFCEYCDAFGNYSCQEFILFYQGPPFNSFREIMNFDCSSNYSYPPQKVKGAQYLLPCEQPAEREAREQRERQQLTRSAKKPPSPSAK